MYICTKFESFKKSMYFSSINVTDIISAFSDYWSTAFLLGMERRALVTKSACHRWVVGLSHPEKWVSNQVPLSGDLSSPSSWNWAAAATAAKSLQSCPTLCDPGDGSSPGSPIPGILQARTLEWIAISFSNAWQWKVKVKSLSRVLLLATPWTAAHQAPPSMGFSRQQYWSGVPLPSPKD